MDITTKRNIGDKVYYLYNEKIHYGEIKGITVNVYKPDAPNKSNKSALQPEKYSIGPMANGAWEYSVYDTKEELIEALIKKIKEDNNGTL